MGYFLLTGPPHEALCYPVAGRVSTRGRYVVVHAWFTGGNEGDRSGRTGNLYPLPPSLTSSLLTKPSPLFNIPLLSKSKMATVGKAELERGVTKETTRLHYLDLNAKHTTFRFAPRPKIFLETQSQVSTRSITSRKAFCCSNMLFKGTNISSVDWSTSMACLWLNVPLPTSCPLKRTWYPVQQK